MSFFCRYFRALCVVYLAGLLLWLGLFRLLGDRAGVLGMVNFLSVYLFLPLPAAPIAALICRQARPTLTTRFLWFGSAAAVLAFVLLWGAQFSPWRKPEYSRLLGGQAHAHQPALAVMTYNVLAWHQETGPVLETIRAENPDVLFLQELNHALASALQAELAESYPYQLLEPQDNPQGIGIISRYPIEKIDQEIPHQWVGGPLLAEMEWNGQRVRLANFHMFPTTRLSPLADVGRYFEVRNEQASLLVGFAAQGGPVILGGDANSVPYSDAHRIFTAHLHDAWQEAGFGLGHTFPGSSVPGSSRPTLAGILVPPWLVRIDYIFYSSEWEAVQTQVAAFDGVSDHRGVAAVLRWKQ